VQPRKDIPFSTLSIFLRFRRLKSIEFDGFTLLEEETPASPQELSEIVKRASQSGKVMTPVGGGTKLHLGNPPRAAQLAVCSCRLRGVVEYEPDNMTVSVLAGTPLNELQDALKEGNQFLPLDPPHSSRATLGGIVACNTSGPLRFRYGTIRDLLIGVKLVHADGTQTKAGGKLVKNVTGYDMCKLYTGSLGTLGILSELTFKVQPRSESVATLFVAYPSIKTALEAAQLFLRSDLLPDAIEAWNREALEGLRLSWSSGEKPWVLMLRFGEVEAAVHWQVEKLEDAASKTGGEILRVLPIQESLEFWERAASAREAQTAGEEALVKCSILYQSTAETARRMEEAGKELGATTALFCHAGTYIIYGRYRWESHDARPPELMRQVLSGLRAHCVSAGGHMVVERVRSEVKNGFDVWGYEAAALEIMRRIKQEFDPRGLLNPGRFVGGI
jgi:glycolate dehydrogenase FAD-binding subunit